MPLVSVIIPTYNRCDILKRCIKSLFEQTFQDFEIIVINDGSTDNTSAFLSTITDSRFKSITFPKNRGGNTARNEGVKQSLGKYCAFLDDDDCWAPEKLEKQMNRIQQDNLDLCYTGIQLYSRKEKYKRHIFNLPKFNDLHKSIMHDAFIGTISTVIIKKNLIDKINGFDPNLSALQDWDLFIRMIKEGCRIHGIDEPLVNYYIGDEKNSTSWNIFKFKQAEKYITQKFYNDPYLPLLKRRLNIIFFKRIFKSRIFLFGFIKYYFSRLFF